VPIAGGKSEGYIKHVIIGLILIRRTVERYKTIQLPSLFGGPSTY
jgi:hypothetical protein